MTDGRSFTNSITTHLPDVNIEFMFFGDREFELRQSISPLTILARGLISNVESSYHAAESSKKCSPPANKQQEDFCYQIWVAVRLLRIILLVEYKFHIPQNAAYLTKAPASIIWLYSFSG